MTKDRRGTGGGYRSRQRDNEMSYGCLVMFVAPVLAILFLVATQVKAATFNASDAHTAMLLEESEGFFKHAGGTGGEGKPVVYVTNLNDSGPGSLRFFAELGNLIVMFEDGLNGQINLTTEIKVESNTTIWGRTKNGTGADIFIHPASDSDSAFKVRKERNNIIFSNLKGDAPGPDDSAPTFITVRGPGGVVWAHHITVIGDGSKNMDGFFDPQSEGVTISYSRIENWDAAILLVPFTNADGTSIPEATIHNNLFINIFARPPRVVGLGSKAHAYNNVISWRGSGMLTLDGGELVAENNLFIAGLDGRAIRGDWAGSGNVIDGDATFDLQSNVFTVPYTYTLKPVEGLLADLEANAGWQSFAVPEPNTCMLVLIAVFIVYTIYGRKHHGRGISSRNS